ncbi:MAG TPA: TlpA disulfide reductase family protein [Anaerolineales bacterium]|nr:TlpA disulfide reductase family protein [Anaerolineales bacterium]
MSPRSSHVLGLIVLGIGLIFTGFAAYALIGQSRRDLNAETPTDFSAIPAAVQIPAPALTLSDIHGFRHSLSDYRGRVLLVNLWATWCPPCQAEMPNLQEFYDQHRDEEFSVVAVEDGDPAPDVISFVQQHALDFSIWLDPTYQATDHAFKTMNLPSSYVIDRHGVIRLEWVGAISEQNLEKYVEPLVKE